MYIYIYTYTYIYIYSARTHTHTQTSQVVRLWKIPLHSSGGQSSGAAQASKRDLYYGKRDLFTGQKKPICTAKQTYG